jgi:hypothetical protein
LRPVWSVAYWNVSLEGRESIRMGWQQSVCPINWNHCRGRGTSLHWTIDRNRDLNQVHRLQTRQKHLAVICNAPSNFGYWSFLNQWSYAISNRYLNFVRLPDRTLPTSLRLLWLSCHIG